MKPVQPPPRIVDLVFGHEVPRPRVRALLAGGLTMVSYAIIMAVLFGSRLSLETWSAELAARVHAELSRENTIELSPPPPPTPPPPPDKPPPPVDKAPPPVAHTPLLAKAPPHAAPPPPAQAGKVIAREPDPNEPVDLTGNTFVTGTATTYAGGATTATGTNKKPVSTEDLARRPSSPAPAKPVAKAPSRARAVMLEDPDWRCPWPREAESDEIDEQTAVVRVLVAADGKAESAEIVSDPGHGFGAAAVECARRTRYSPALDVDGTAIRATSPPIRVHFIR